jgi:acyl-CoA reductase-like NAD-dependent aldehyde dehydrogenase
VEIATTKSAPKLIVERTNREKVVVLVVLIDRKAAERVREIIDDALDKGAVLAAGRHIDGTIVSTTVVDRATFAMHIYHEETFGPPVSFVCVKDIEEATRVSNYTEHGPGAAVFGSDISRALDVARRIDAGSTHINGPTVQEEQQIPFGGMKAAEMGVSEAEQ